MSTTSKRVILLAIDKFDWPLVQQLIDAGQLPYIQQLVEQGSSGKMTVKPPFSDTAMWTTLATGTDAHTHRVYDDLEVREDGLTVQRVSSLSVQSPPFWHSAMLAGKVTRIIGWPATAPAMIPPEAAQGCCVVAPGLTGALPLPEGQWLAPPHTVAPETQRQAIVSKLVDPHELSLELIQPLLPPGCHNEHVQRLALGLLAELSGVHNIVTDWASDDGWELLSLRTDVLAKWEQARAYLDDEAPELLAPWYAYIDLLVGRYMALAGKDSHLLIVSPKGTAKPGADDSERLLGVTGEGCFIAAGPSVPADLLLQRVDDTDICPTILDLLGVDWEQTHGQPLFAAAQHSAGAQARQYAALPAMPALPDTQHARQSLQWLAKFNIQPVDLSPLFPARDRAQANALAGWALLAIEKGHHDSAKNALAQALALQPDDLMIRFALAELLFLSDNPEECKYLADAVPESVMASSWGDAVRGVIALAEKNWADAEAAFETLAMTADSPINAWLWMGHTKYAQREWRAAHSWYTKALRHKGESPQCWVQIAHTQFQLQEWQAAINSLSRAIAWQPLNARLFSLRAAAYTESGQVLHAQSDLIRALRLDPSDSEIQRKLNELMLSTTSQVKTQR